MGGPIEKFIEPLGEKLLAKLFPIFADRNEIKIAVNHFLTQVFITLSLSTLGLIWTPARWVALASFVLVPVAEIKDMKRGRWVDFYSRGLGWVYGIAPAIVSFFK